LGPLCLRGSDHEQALCRPGARALAEKGRASELDWPPFSVPYKPSLTVSETHRSPYASENSGSLSAPAQGQRRHGGAELAQGQVIEVPLRRGDARVSEQLLDGDHVPTGPQSPDGVRVTQ
jgi:hypothetical protein